MVIRYTKIFTQTPMGIVKFSSDFEYFVFMDIKGEASGSLFISYYFKMLIIIVLIY